ncbi:o-acyltransferase [Anaeramoeba flamelloides]|uniref:O-acyltransferase n=1 Tax=Anaeramoeba flamelloides TaxID=1746091 RepID=A0AAV7Z952_9EUKA|nr:o-acyltransferase [Anaeramoeba flamelloides]
MKKGKLIILIFFLIFVSQARCNSDFCYNELLSLLGGFYPNSTQMMESWGSETNLLGDWYQCESLKPDKIAHYCLAEADIGTTISLGTCMPYSCSSSDLTILSPKILAVLQLEGSAEFICSDPINKRFGFYFMSTFCCLIGFLVLLGTLLDYYVFNYPKPENEEAQIIDLSQDQKNDFIKISDLKENEQTFFDTTDSENDLNDPRLLNQENVENKQNVHINDIQVKEIDNPLGELFDEGLGELPNTNDPEFKKIFQDSILSYNWAKFLLQFSLIKNVRRLFSQYPSPINAFNSIRTLSMLWIILGHTYSFMLYFPVFNYAHVLEIFQRWSLQIIFAAEFGVDSFFFMSGFLACYSMFKSLQRINKIPVHLAYLHRFLRLAPTLMFCLFINLFLGVHMGAGPIWPPFVNSTRKGCDKYWWTNLLFINNWYPKKFKEECFGHTWYLANDFQFFIIALVLIWILWKWRKTGISIILSLIGGSILYKILISRHYNLSVDVLDQTDSYWDWIYEKPMSRIDVYLVGILVCLIVWDKNSKNSYFIKKIKVPFTLRHLIFAASLTLIGLTSFGPYGIYKKNPDHWSESLHIFYLSCSRIGFVIGLSGLVVLWINGYYKPLSSLLSAKFWTPLARLTYCAYLMHPTIIFIFLNNQKYPIYLSNIVVIVHYLAILPVSYIVSLIITLCVESPLMNFEKMFFEWLNSKKKK